MSEPIGRNDKRLRIRIEAATSWGELIERLIVGVDRVTLTADEAERDAVSLEAMAAWLRQKHDRPRRRTAEETP